MKRGNKIYIFVLLNNYANIGRRHNYFKLPRKIIEHNEENFWKINDQTVEHENENIVDRFGNAGI